METLGFEDNEPLHDRYHLHKVVLILHKRLIFFFFLAFEN